MLYSPVSREEAAPPSRPPATSARYVSRHRPGTLPHFEVRIDVEVDRIALVYKNANVRLMTLGLLGETAIDISGGNDHSGKAEAGQVFVGNRVPDFSEAIAKMLGIIQPVATEATATLKELQSTVTNLSKITDDNSPLTLALGQFKTFTEHLNEITAPDSSLSKSLAHIEDLSNQLTKNDNITVTLANFRDSSEKLKTAFDSLEPGPRSTLCATRKTFTATLRSEPWRLIWPSTKKYPEEEATPAPVRKATRAKSGRTNP